MKKTLSRIGTLLAAAMLSLGILAAPAFATEFAYTEIGGGTTNLHKYLVVEKDTVSPKITFSYTIAPGEAVTPATEDTLPVYAGPAGASVADVEFAAGAASTPGATGQPITDANKLYGEKDIVITFPTTGFNKPGVYRYILTEKNSNKENVGGVLYDVNAPDGTAKTRIRTIDVYVIDNNGTLEVQGYVAYDGTVSTAPAQDYNPNGAATDDYANGDTSGSGIGAKLNQYINQIKTNTMTVEKIIAGNQGDKTSTWNINVVFTGLPTGVTPKYAKIEENGTAIASPTYANYKSGTDLPYSHNDKYKFIGIPEGVSYEVVESDANTEGYTTTYANAKYAFGADGTIEDKDNAVVTNTREGTIPTGLFLNYKPFWIMGAIALMLAIAFAAKRRNRFADEV